MIWREATAADIPAAVALLRDDMLGQGREVSDLSTYLDAFAAMQAEGGNRLILGEEAGEVIACYQLITISGLSLSAARRAQVEGVRVRADRRGAGIGTALMADAEARARAAGCVLMQLTTNRDRRDAHRFYDRLGFTASHIGYKKSL